MSRRRNTPEERLRAVEDYLSGKRSSTQICQDLKLKSRHNIQEWVWLYQKHGEEAFIAREGNKSYSEQLKIAAVEEYLSEGGSVRYICAKYNISSTQTLRNWIKQYNSNIKLTDYDPKPEVYMAAARRKTTINERKEIVEYCLSHNKDYKGSAEKYDVSYNQVYSWTKSYLANGLEGLKDHRGRRKADEELSELEKLRRENLRLKRQLEEERRAVELLKKVQEFEGRRYSGKGNKNPNT